jgi:outer membrane protein
MDFRRFTIISLFFLFMTNLAVSQTQTSDSLGLDEAIKLTVENHPAALQATQGVFSSQARVEQSKGSYYPDISGLASYAHIWPVPQFETQGGSSPLAPADNYDFHLGLFQTVYDFGRRTTSVNLAKSGVQMASDNVELIKSNLSYQTIQTFYTILFLQEDVKVIDDQMDALNQHLDITQKKVNTGTATSFDVLTTQVRVATAQSQRIDAVNALHKQEILFRQLTGISSEKPIMLKGEFQSRQVSLNTDSLIVLALSQLPEAKLSKNAENSAQIQHRLASLGNRPSLNVNFIYGFKNGYFPDLNTLEANLVAGAEIRVPIFNGFQTKHQVRQAQANLNAAQEHSRDIARQVTSNVTRAISDVQASQEKIATSEPQVAQAEQAVTMAQGRYNAGVATNLDLLDAETSLADAKLIHLRALYELVISEYALDRAVGTMVW